MSKKIIRVSSNKGLVPAYPLCRRYTTYSQSRNTTLLATSMLSLWANYGGLKSKHFHCNCKVFGFAILQLCYNRRGFSLASIFTMGLSMGLFTIFTIGEKSQWCWCRLEVSMTQLQYSIAVMRVDPQYRLLYSLNIDVCYRKEFCTCFINRTLINRTVWCNHVLQNQQQ